MPDEPAPESEPRAIAKYSAIWQGPDPGEGNWVREILGPVLGEWVIDGARQVVLDHAIVFDHFVIARDIGYYEKFRGKDAFLVDFADENYDFQPEIYANFRGVLRCHWSDVFRRDTVHPLPLGYTRDLRIPREPVRKATDRHYVWSFLGQMNKSSRPDMAYALASIEPHLLFATDDVKGIAMWNHGLQGPRRYSQAENTAAMLDSIFAPCPMGNVNLECYRVYEALECGTIPIVEKRMTLDYFRDLWGEHPVPAVRSWTEARRLIRRLLENPAEMDALQERCTQWWRQYKLNYTRGAEEFLARRSAATEPLSAADIVLPKHALPVWKVAELLRHHDRHAFMRRMQRQAVRLFTSGKLRVTTRRPDRG